MEVAQVFKVVYIIELTNSVINKAVKLGVNKEV